MKVKTVWYLPTVNICEYELDVKKKQNFPEVNMAEEQEILGIVLTRQKGKDQTCI